MRPYMSGPIVLPGTDMFLAQRQLSSGRVNRVSPDAIAADVSDIQRSLVRREVSGVGAMSEAAEVED